MHFRKIQHNDLQRIAVLIQDGRSAREIASEFGCTARTIRNNVAPHAALRERLLQNGKGRGGKGPKSRISIETARNLLEQGFSYQDLGRLFSVQPRTVRRTLREAG